VEFTILGPLEVRENGRTLAVRGKQRALLACLLLEPRTALSRERLIDDLWGDEPPETAAKAVQVFAGRLRKTLPGLPLVTRGTAYVLDIDPAQVDRHVFERHLDAGRKALAEGRPAEAAGALGDALALWRGPALADVHEPFARIAADRLEDLRLAALETRIDADLALGGHTQLVGELEELVATHPLRESFRAQLMLALYRSGRQAEALEAYRDTRRVLVDDLGLEPSRALQQLERRILAQDPALDRPVPEEPESEEIADAHLRKAWRRPTIIAIAGVALSALATAALVTRGEPGGLNGVSANSVGIIDPATNRIVAEIPVGIRPGPVGAGAGAVWVGNLQDRTLARIDPRKRKVVAFITLGSRTPTGVAAGSRAVWVAHGLRGELSRVDPQYDRVTATRRVARSLGDRQHGAVAVGYGRVWAVYGDATLARVDPISLRVSRSFAGTAPTAVALAAGSVWVANSEDSTVERFNPTTLEVVKPITVGRRPVALASGEGAVWVANAGEDTVTRIDLSTNSTRTIQVGDGPAAVAVGAGAVWVANAGARTVSRIDPAAREVVETIELHNAPAGIVVAERLVWVTAQTP
jgi:YVTN family beta-propeller protein